MWSLRRGRGLYPRFLRASTAIIFFRGVFQRTPSIPGVRAPRFVVTRRTASRLAGSDRIKSRWSERTFPQRSSFTASAIRACSRSTVLYVAGQSIIDHRTTPSGVALSFTGSPIAIPPSIGSPSSLAEKHRTGRGLAFAPGKFRTRIRPITGRHSLLPASYSRTPLGFPCGRLARVLLGAGTILAFSRLIGGPGRKDRAEPSGRTYGVYKFRFRSL